MEPNGQIDYNLSVMLSFNNYSLQCKLHDNMYNKFHRT